MIRLIPYLLVLTAILADIPVFYKIFVDESFPMAIAVVCHLLCALLSSAGIYYSLARAGRKKKRGNVWLVYFFCVTLLLPVFGLAIAMISYGWQKIISKRPPPVFTDSITVQDPIMFQKRRLRSKDLELLERTDIQPFIDILKKNETGLKRSVIRILGSLRSRQTVRNLLTALQDPDIEIRLYAAGILSKLEDSFTMEVKERSTLLSSDPTNEKLKYDLSEVYRSYAESGLLEATSQNFYYNECIKTLLSINESPLRNYRIAGAYYKMAELDKALVFVNSAIDSDHSNTKYELLKLEIIFAMKDYKGLKAEITEDAKDKLRKINSEMAEFWA